MDLTQALMTALAVVWGVTCAMGTVLWKDMLECRKDRNKLNDRVGRLEREAGISEGQLDSYENCPSTTCPFKGGLSMWILFLGCLCLVFAGCHLQDYSRSYYLAGVDRFGQRVEIGATFTPPQARTVMETLEREGVIGPGAKLVEVEEPLQPAAMQLATLTSGSAPGLPTTGTKASAAPWVGPASPGVPMVWLAREGKLRVESDAVNIASLRAAGWVDAPPPGFEDGFAPQWDGRAVKWRVRKVPGSARVGLESPTPAVRPEGLTSMGRGAR